MDEQPLAGGDVTDVVRVGDTVRRRPVGPHTPAVHALLRHLEAAGFSGAPRVLGFDEEGREVLSWVDGVPATPPLTDFMTSEEALAGVAELLRRYHDAAASFVAPPDARWQRWVGAPAEGEVVCHNDLFPPNVIFRDRGPVALVDWDFAAPGPGLLDVAGAVKQWVPLKSAEHREGWGWPDADPGPRLRLFCDVYRLSAAGRAGLLDAVARRNRIALETHRAWAAAGVPGFVEMWRAGSGDLIAADGRWLAGRRRALERALRRPGR